MANRINFKRNLGNAPEARAFASALFSREEKEYCEMLGDGMFVDDRWFPHDSTVVERARYHASFVSRQERNRRRREKRKLAARERHETGARMGKPRPRRPILSQAPEALQVNRLPLERRKCIRRSTVAACPTAGEIRTAWRYRNGSERNRVRLGALLMDLECYVDNSLIVIVVRNRRKIVGRNGGLRAWVRENAPELDSHYKTLQRFKAIAKRMRQELDILDPMPLSALLDDELTASEVERLEVHGQPRDGESKPAQLRFPWEKSAVHVDADNRPYLENENYHLTSYSIPVEILDNLQGLRAIFKAALILNGKGKRTIENYSMGSGRSGIEWTGSEGAGTRKGVAGEFKEMLGYVGRHPEFLVEVGKRLVRDVAGDFGVALLPDRTLRRIAEGERIGIGRIALDVAGAYLQFYDACLFCRRN